MKPTEGSQNSSTKAEINPKIPKSRVHVNTIAQWYTADDWARCAVKEVAI